jgi:stage III sporulation protein SpoIIIAA
LRRGAVAGTVCPMADDFAAILEVLPEPLREAMEDLPSADVLEVVLDLGRPPEARLAGEGGRTALLSTQPVTPQVLEGVLGHVSELGEDNRAGIERTLHRVSAIRNRRGRVVGLTLRVGRAVFGTIDALRDLVESGKNILLLGRPGIGKTTHLREIARVLADDLHKRVMVVDTSNEIGGDGDIPHPAIGAARRMQVRRPELQHAVMIEAVENHMPEVIIVDEIGTAQEALAARTIAERGVQLVATAHGNTLENLVLNPTLSDLVGGVQTVTLSDEEARRRRTLKTVSERKAPPTFDVVVELVNRDEVVVHPDTAQGVDALLSGRPLAGERRTRREGRVEVTSAPARALPVVAPSPAAPGGDPNGPLRIYVHGVGKQIIERVLRGVEETKWVGRPEAADALFVLRTRADEPRIRRAMARPGVAVHLLKRATGAELRRAVRASLMEVAGEPDAVRAALAEAEHAVERALNEAVPVSLAPRPPRLRRLQHELADRFHLETRSEGEGPTRHLVVYPPPSV